MRPHIIALTGGIGAGKSVVSRILTLWGYPVYDSDKNAKFIMSENAGIKEQLRKEFGESIFIGEEIDRTCLADIVFRDSAKLGILNNIVHGAVKEHFKAWCEQKPARLVFIETAILYESGLNELVDAEWRVYAPVDIRVERVVKRNSISEEKVLDRIKAQIYKPGEYDLKPPVTELCNDGRKAVMPQLIEALMRCFQN